MPSKRARRTRLLDGHTRSIHRRTRNSVAWDFHKWPPKTTFPLFLLFLSKYGVGPRALEGRSQVARDG